MCPEEAAVEFVSKRERSHHVFSQNIHCSLLAKLVYLLLEHVFETDMLLYVLYAVSLSIWPPNGFYCIGTGWEYFPLLISRTVTWTGKRHQS